MRLGHNRISAATRKEFTDRLYLIDDNIPSNYASIVVLKNPTLSVHRIINVRRGITIDFDILSILEEIARENQSQQ